MTDISKIIDGIKNSKNDNKWCLIGPNTSGKTYFIKKFFNANTTESIKINDHGIDQSKQNKEEIHINGNHYYYKSDETERGKYRDLNPDKYKVPISESSQNILMFVNNQLEELNKIHNQSKGIKRIIGIFETFRKYNLNTVNYVLIDEPENSLDDIRFNIISEFFDLLVDNNKKVIFSTHSTRFYQINKMSIENTIMLNSDRSLVKITLNDIKGIYKDMIKTYKKEKSIKELASKQYLPNELLTIHIKQLIHEEGFINALFYNKITLVEGFSDKVIFDNLKTYKQLDSYFYITRGKYKMIFFYKLFTRLNKEVSIVIDSDSDKDKNHSLRKLTCYLKDNISTNVIIFDKNLENELDMDDNFYKGIEL